MAEQVIVLPTDGANVGKKVRTRERVIGANTIQEHYFIPQRERVIEGVYLFNSGVLSVNATADTFPAGRIWIQNPVGSAKLIALRRMECEFSAVAATASLTAPRIAIQKFTFTGSFSGATLTGAKRDENDVAQVFDVRTANTGPTITSVGIAYAFVTPALVTAVGVFGGVMLEYEPEEDGMIILRAGHGLCITQPDVGTATDPRRYVLNFAVEQFTLP